MPRVWNDLVYPMAERIGIPIRLPSVSPQPRTEKAFLVLQLAHEHNIAGTYSQAMFQAFFQDDLDIGDEEVIVDVSRTLGLEAEAMASPARKRQHQADLAYATETMRITAVPGIVIDGTPLQGTPSATRLKKAVDALTTSKGCRP